jgi:hypothetical protein
MSDNVSSTAGSDLNYEIRNYQGTVALIYKIMELLLMAVSILREVRNSRIRKSQKEKIDELIAKTDTVSSNIGISLL